MAQTGTPHLMKEVERQADDDVGQNIHILHAVFGFVDTAVPVWHGTNC
jgi:hypothetical protein